MKKRIFCLAMLAGVLSVPAGTAAKAAPHMWIGFQDDASFRWRPDRENNLDAAKQAGATIVRAWAYWPQVAPTRPSNAANPFDPAYRFNDIDELVRGAQSRGMEVLLTPWGTPRWANGKTANYAPRNPADWTSFIRALALRYSGRYPGYPAVRFWSIWNEPNLNQFLAPQFVGTKDTSPAIYAKLYRAAYGAIKQAIPTAQVAIGETGPRGRDKPLGSSSTQDTHSPGKFAQLLAAQRPKLRFDAWAHHPYALPQTAPVTQRVKWPNVSLVSTSKFATFIDTSFHRTNTPMWITEYAYQTKPPLSAGAVPLATQAANVRTALSIVARDPRVQMFIWFTFRDDAGNPWKSGIVANDNSPKPAYATFADTAKPLDGRDLMVTVKAGREPVVAVPARELATHTAPGEPVGVSYALYDGTKWLAIHQPQLPMGRDGWFTLPVQLVPERGHTYTVIITANAHGDYIRRQLTLTAT